MYLTVVGGLKISAPISYLHEMCTVFRKKTPTYIFDYNSRVSLSIFILFVPLKRGMNTPQFIDDVITVSPCTSQSLRHRVTS